jgi:hypothetical protein
MCTILMILFCSRYIYSQIKFYGILGNNYSSLWIIHYGQFRLNSDNGEAYSLFILKRMDFTSYIFHFETVVVLIVSKFIIFDLSTLEGALYLNILFSLPQYYQMFYGI